MLGDSDERRLVVADEDDKRQSGKVRACRTVMKEERRPTDLAELMELIL